MRVLVLMHEDLVPPDSLEGRTEKEILPWRTEYDVVSALRAMGHEVRPLGVARDLGVVEAAIRDWKPQVAFNVLEEFHGVSVYDHHVVAWLELMKQPYTGCNPRGLMLAHDKALSKKILTYHRVLVPGFAVFPQDRRLRRPKWLRFPLLVKSLTEEGSVGIAQASIVNDDEKLAERIEFVHRTLRTDAIAEEYIDGRELYVGVIGNRTLETLPVWEMLFTQLREEAPKIATDRIKMDPEYQKKAGIVTREAEGIAPEILAHIVRTSRRIYRDLDLSGYARMDLRLTPEGRVYLLEANPNPNLARDEDFARSAERAGIPYEELLQRILNLGLHYRPEWRRA